eukprot:429600-Prymnesium_polylepis.1
MGGAWSKHSPGRDTVAAHARPERCGLPRTPLRARQLLLDVVPRRPPGQPFRTLRATAPAPAAPNLILGLAADGGGPATKGAGPRTRSVQPGWSSARVAAGRTNRWVAHSTARGAASLAQLFRSRARRTVAARRASPTDQR